MARRAKSSLGREVVAVRDALRALEKSLGSLADAITAGSPVTRPGQVEGKRKPKLSLPASAP
jgi:hypothetical protein